MATEFEEKKQRHASGESSKSGDSVGSYIPTPPDGGYGWVIVLASFLNHIIVDGISFTFGVFYIVFLKYFKESSSKTALVGSLLVGTYLITGPIASALTNRFGCRPVCITGAFIAAGSFFLSTFSPNVNVLMLTYGVMAGFGFGLVYLPSVVSVSYYFEKRRALATGIAVCGAGVGGFMFAPIGRILVEQMEWQSGMMVISGVVLLCVLFGALLKPLESAKKSKELPREKNMLDRLREKAKNKLGVKRSDSVISETHHHNVAQKVHQMKLNREKLIREEDGESEYGSSAVMNSSNQMERPRVGSFKIVNGEVNVPEILVEGEVHDFSSHSNHGNECTGMVSPTSPTDPIYKPSKKTNPLMAAILHRKLNEMEGNKQSGSTQQPDTNGSESNCNDVGKADKPFRALESAPNLAHHKTHGPHENLIKSQGKYHSDVWCTKKRHSKQRRDRHVPKEDYARPMYRKDIFYSGSVRHIAQFKSNPDVATYVQSMTSIPDAVHPENESKFWKVCCLPKVSTDVLKTMLDVSLLKDPVFAIAAIANAFGMLGVYVPFVFVVERAIGLGVDTSKAAFLLSVIGITNTIGRVLAGFLADFKCVNTLLLHNVAVIIAGVCCVLNMFCTTYPLMCVFAAVFGLCFATWISVTPIILCDLLGMEKLTNAFGLLTMVRGICSVAGSPLAGAVYDSTKDYDAAFHVGGAIMIITGVMFCLLLLPCLQRRTYKYRQDHPPQILVVETEEDLLNTAQNPA